MTRSRINRLWMTVGLALAGVAAGPVTAATAAAPITISDKPALFTNQPDATFTFSPGGSFLCTVDNNPQVGCGSTFLVQGLAEGAHSITVQADPVTCDPAACPTQVSYSWTEDFTPPDTSLTGQPPALTNSTTAQFTFKSSDPTATFRCSLNGASPSPCSSPVTYSGLSAATRKFAVYAVDQAGNITVPAQQATWTVDLTPPTTTIASGPTGYDLTATPTFTFTSSKPNSTFECALDGGAFSACPASDTLPVTADGQHTLAVRATDAAGNTDPSPATRTWTIDVTGPAAPVLTITHNTPGLITKRPPTGTVHHRAGDRASAAAVGPGGPGPVSEPFLTTPLALITWHPADANTVGVTVSELGPGPATVVSTALSASLPRTLPYGAQTCYQAVAVDAAGVQSKPTTACVAVPYPASGLQGDYLSGSSSYDDGSNAHSSTLVTDTQAFGGSYLRLDQGGKLKYLLAECAYFGPWGGCGYDHNRLVVVVATTCRSCGSISIQVDGFSGLDDQGMPTGADTTFTHTLNLHSSALHHKQLFVMAMPASDATDETYLHVVRVTGTPRIEGLWMQ